MLSPVFTCTPTEGRRRRAHCVLDRASEPRGRLQVARPRWPPGGSAGSWELFSARGAESGHRRARGGDEEPRRLRSPAGAGPASPGDSKTHSFSTQLFLASCRAASCLSHYLCREPPPPPNPDVSAHTSRRRSCRAGRAPPSRPRPCREDARPGTRARPRRAREQPEGGARTRRQSAREWWSRKAFRCGSGNHGDSSRVGGQMQEKWEENALSLQGHQQRLSLSSYRHNRLNVGVFEEFTSVLIQLSQVASMSLRE